MVRDLAQIPEYEKEQLQDFITRHSAQRLDRMFFDFVEPESMPPRLLEHYIWVGDGRKDEAESIMRKCAEKWDVCSEDVCLDSYILRSLQEAKIPHMIEEIDYGKKCSIARKDRTWKQKIA